MMRDDLPGQAGQSGIGGQTDDGTKKPPPVRGVFVPSERPGDLACPGRPFPDWFEVEFKGQWFRPIGVCPHTRLDGVETFLVTWRAACVGCGEAFTMQTGRVFKNPTRRCPHCRGQPRARLRGNG